MPLRRLAEFHDRIADEVAPEHHERRAVAWLLDLTPEGGFRGWIQTLTEDQKRGVERTVPYMRRRGPKAFLLSDKAEYVLGRLPDETEAADKNVKGHNDFVALVKACAEATGVPEVIAVDRFFEQYFEEAMTAAASEAAGMKGSDLIVIRVGERIVTDLPAVRAWWQEQREAAIVGEADRGLQRKKACAGSGRSLECIVCGQIGPVVKRSPVELRLGRERVQLISADKTAFESYGLENSEIAPVCLSCAIKYGQAAGYLMGSPDHHRAIANLHWIWWTRSGQPFDGLSLIAEPQTAAVERLLKAPFGRSGVPAIDDDAFYAAALSANMSRLIVRDWLETTVGEVSEHLRQWFLLQRLVGPKGEAYEPMGLYGLACSLVRDEKDLPRQSVSDFLGAAVQGRRLPTGLLAQAIRRARVDKEPVTRPRAMLVKMILNSDPERNFPMVQEALDLTNRTPAYLCGRLLAVLEDTQRAALGKINATIVDRFFATASSAPASVFGRLLRGAQNHLHVLRRDREGTWHALQQRLEEIMAGLDNFPPVLDMKEQGLFMLGYYHERAENRRQRTARYEARKAAGAAPDPDDDDDASDN